MSRNRIYTKVFNNWWLKRFIIGITAALLIFCVYLYTIPQAALSPVINRHIDAKTDFDPSDYGLEANKFTVTTSDGLELKGEEFKSEINKGVIILTAGLYNPVPESLYGHAALLIENGYSVIIYNSRAHQTSEGNLVSHGINEYKDIDAVIDYVRSFTTYLNSPIILMGWNTGAAASIYAAAENKYVSGLISIGSYADTREYFYKQMAGRAKVPDLFLKLGKPFLPLYLKITFGFKCLDKSPSEELSKVDCPVFIIHSKGDSDIPYQDAKTNYKAVLSDGTELWIRDTDNQYVTDYFINLKMDEEYCSKLIGFLDSNYTVKEEAKAGD